MTGSKTNADGRASETLAHLITEQDVHAYVDGQLPPARRRAVEAFLAEHEMTARQAVTYLRSTFDLRAVRDRLYEDQALKSEIDALMAKRAAKARDPKAEPAWRAASA